MIRAVLLLITFIFLFAGLWLSAARLLTNYAPTVSVDFPWFDPDIVLLETKDQLLNSGDETTPILVSPIMQKRLARLSPLDNAAYIPSLIEASTERDLNRMSALSAHVLKINPRNRAARFVDAQLAVFSNRPDLAMPALERLVELDRAHRDQYIQEMVSIAGLAGGQELILASLENQPNWGIHLVRALADNVDDPPFLLRALAYFPAAQSNYVQALVKREAYEEAQTVFFDFLGEAERDSFTIPYDNRFEGLAGAKPFNWQINKRFAGFENRGGLFISFFGQGRPAIARQVIRLSPGDYAASFSMSGELHQNGGHLRWTLSCLPGEEKLLSLDIKTLLASNSDIEASFTVREDLDCTFVNLQLDGVAGAFPRTARIMVSEVELFRIEAE